MKASKPHGIMAPTSSTLISFLMESEPAAPFDLADLASLLLRLLWCSLLATSCFAMLAVASPPAMSPIETSLTLPPWQVLILDASSCDTPPATSQFETSPMSPPWDASHSSAPMWHLLFQCPLLQCPPAMSHFETFLLLPCLDILYWDASCCDALLQCLILRLLKDPLALTSHF